MVPCATAGEMENKVDLKEFLISSLFVPATRTNTTCKTKKKSIK
jgi:hypothetical protein